LVNLLNNAAKYTEPGGRVWLTADQDGSEAVVRVRDTGVGIAPEMLPHVFELFTQAEWSLHQAQGGLGIGLAIVRRLVALHGGTITVHSAGLGQGSEFTVRLPASAARDKPARAQDRGPVPTPEKQPRHRILVVDDNVDAAQSLGMLLTFEGHEVRVVHDGPAALRTAADFSPEVVLLDLGLPGMDGYQVACRLREHFGRDQLLIVAITGYGQDEDRRRSQEAGCSAHLLKPIDLDALRTLLGHASSLLRRRIPKG
jgi:CheY-like chemotaxis protein